MFPDFGEKTSMSYHRLQDFYTSRRASLQVGAECESVDSKGEGTTHPQPRAKTACPGIHRPVQPVQRQAQDGGVHVGRPHTGGVAVLLRSGDDRRDGRQCHQCRAGVEPQPTRSTKSE